MKPLGHRVTAGGHYCSACGNTPVIAPIVMDPVITEVRADGRREHFVIGPDGTRKPL
jgi:hypothetical protein